MDKTFIEDITIINSSWVSYANCITSYKVAAILNIGNLYRINVGLIDIVGSLEQFVENQQYDNFTVYNCSTSVKDFDTLENAFKFDKEMFDKSKVIKEELKKWKGCIIESDTINNVVRENEQYFSGYVSGNYRTRYRLRVPRKLTNAIRYAIIGKRGRLALMQDVKINAPVELLKI